MSFRKRNVVVSSPGSVAGPSKTAEKDAIPGVRPSPLDGRLTTSTGTRSLDSLLAGHAGLSLGTSILIEESGATDFSGALLRYYAAEGVVQGHYVHVLGVGDAWARELPGVQVVTASSAKTVEQKIQGDKMKIAWRYERLGEFGKDRNASIVSAPGLNEGGRQAIFCHDFDLSKRLTLPAPQSLRCIPVASQRSSPLREDNASKSPFSDFLQHLTSQLSVTPPTAIHRVVIPTLLSPALYPHSASVPQHVLQFLHAIRALLRKYSSQLTVMITLPLSLYPRTTGLTRWIEMLNDGVLELAPFPSHANLALATSASGSATSQEEPPQGMLRVHRIPIFHEKGGGGGELSGHGDDLAFTLSRRKGLVIKPFSLPPLDEDPDAHGTGSGHSHGKATKVDIEF